MARRTDGLIKNFKAEAAVSKFRIVKFGATDEAVVQAAAVGDAMFGVSLELDAAVGEPCDVALGGLADVVYGGAVTRGDLLTSDAAGKAVAAAPTAGINNRIIGIAMASGALDDIGVVDVMPGRIQG